MNSSSNNSLGCLGCLLIIAMSVGALAVATWVVLTVAKGVLGA